MTESVRELYNRVIKKGTCSVCGACVISCPLDLLSFRENIFLSPVSHESDVIKSDVREIEDKCISCGMCINNCPVHSFGVEKIEKYLNMNFLDNPLGNVIAALVGRSLNDEILRNAQNGGIATTLFKYLLEHEYVDAVVVAGYDDSSPWKPVPLIVDSSNIDLLYKAQKSKYFPSWMLLGVKKAVELGYKRIAVTLLPCQLHGIANMELNNFKKYVDKIFLKVGLFCFGTYWYNDLSKWLMKKYKIGIDEIAKFDLNRRSFVIYLKNGHFVTGKRMEIIKYLRGSCKHCYDFTGVLADISLGEIGSPQSWTTIIVRSQKGLDILREMENENEIELKPISLSNLDMLYGLAILKYRYHITKTVFKLSDEKIESLVQKTVKVSSKMLFDIYMINIITNTGIPLYAKTINSYASDSDPNLLSSFVAALINFSKNISKENAELKTIDLGKQKIIIEHGENVSILALVKEDNNILRSILKSIGVEIELRKLHEKAENLGDVNEIEKEIDSIITKILQR